MPRPRSIFCSRRRGPVLSIGAHSQDDQARLVAEASMLLGGQLRPGTVHRVNIMHDPRCRRPQGQPCTCTPTVELPVDPERN